MLFRPLGFFDNRLISSVFPQTVGIDSLRLSYFSSDTTTLQGWLVPAKLNNRVLVGGRLEGLVAGLETGLAIQYSPVTDLNSLPNFDLELVQVGYHFKGEREIGFWSEGRFDFEKSPTSNAFRTEAVFGLDYTFNFGEGLHFLLEYFLSAKEQDFTRSDLQGTTTIHQFGLQLDQPLGIATIWRVFGFYDVRDGSFQISPQIEYAVTEQTFLYLQGNWGGDVKGEENLGRLFRKGSVLTATESSIGFTFIVFF